MPAVCWFAALLFLRSAGSAVAAHADDVPPRPDFHYATELNADNFEELVEEVANNTTPGKNPPYLPLVMFHVTWCKHCRHALPEFEEAAKIVDTAKQGGSLSHLPAPPKFFLIECDSGPRATEVCAKHTGTSFPVVKLFRNHRAVRFNRPRTSRVFAWWSTHAARSAITELESAEHIAQAGQQATAFLLKADFNEHKHIVEGWAEVALDFLEEYNHYVVQPSTEAGRHLPGVAPSVIVKGSGLEPLPFYGEMDRETLRAWVNINRFPAVVKFADWTIGDLLQCGLPVVAFAYNGSDAGLQEFTEVARDLRTSQKYIFTAVNMSDADIRTYMGNKFPLVTASPQVFLFSGENSYWEDPSLVDLKGLTHDRINSLMASAEAKHDGSWTSTFKARRKQVARLATGSFVGAVIVVMVPSLAASCCWLCVRELMRGDQLEEGVVKKED